ncbi:hypothetical protein BZG36_03921 [Bifiguratus adelaidae]|uniref:Septin-type G domain-containing protein n=1 Tax=Bifiguratus adelaidae TaxID=1938954 RepID=A0A261XZ68_9FUNG|nr:hypothetical protein BZG36_03921 [Bifiguratus adelaidae]
MKVTTSPTSLSDGIGQVRIMVVGDTAVGKSAFCQILLSAIEQQLGLQQEQTSPKPTSAKRVHEYKASQCWPGKTANNGLTNVHLWEMPGYSSVTASCATPDHIMANVEGYLLFAFRSLHHLFRQHVDPSALFRSLAGLSAATPRNDPLTPHLFDICFYLLLDRIKPIDAIYMKRLAVYTNIVPIVVTEHVHGERAWQDKLKRLYKKILDALCVHKVDLYRGHLCLNYGRTHIMSMEANRVSPAGAHMIQQLCRETLIEQLSQLRHLNLERYLNWVAAQCTTSGVHPPKTTAFISPLLDPLTVEQETLGMLIVTCFMALCLAGGVIIEIVAL